MRKAYAIIGAIAALALAGCYDQPSTNSVDAAGNPVAQQNNGMSPGMGSFLGAMGGTVIGNMLSRPRAAAPAVVSAPPPVQHVVVNKTVVNKTIIQQPVRTAPRIQPSMPRSSFSSRSYSSFRGGRR
jgi:hypothetical protein